MPVYEYYCTKCAAVHEVSQKITDKPIASCPVCKSKKIKKLISRSSFQLKGTGWYVTDYRGKNSSVNGNGKAHAEDHESKPPDSEPSKTSEKPKEPASKTPSPTPSSEKD